MSGASLIVIVMGIPWPKTGATYSHGRYLDIFILYAVVIIDYNYNGLKVISFKRHYLKLLYNALQKSN